jgi:hypothetical protein
MIKTRGNVRNSSRFQVLHITLCFTSVSSKTWIITGTFFPTFASKAALPLQASHTNTKYSSGPKTNLTFGRSPNVRGKPHHRPNVEAPSKRSTYSPSFHPFRIEEALSSSSICPTFSLLCLHQAEKAEGRSLHKVRNIFLEQYAISMVNCGVLVEKRKETWWLEGSLKEGVRVLSKEGREKKTRRERGETEDATWQ